MAKVMIPRAVGVVPPSQAGREGLTSRGVGGEEGDSRGGDEMAYGDGKRYISMKLGLAIGYRSWDGDDMKCQRETETGPETGPETETETGWRQRQ
jgi:hypothetical protein